MNLLLDTHTLIWLLEGDSQLSLPALKLIEQPQNRLFVSMATLWEMGIKISLGKLAVTKSLADIHQGILNNGIDIIPVSFPHILRVSRLPFHHKDPFDRIIISQAMEENLVIISKDGHFVAYTPNVFWN
jgi:PIN domain nuclease of toxin-antitoxin system